MEKSRVDNVDWIVEWRQCEIRVELNRRDVLG